MEAQDRSASAGSPRSSSPTSKESVPIATLTGAVASGYSPLSGLALTNKLPGAGGGTGGAYAPTDFSNPGAPTLPSPFTKAAGTPDNTTVGAYTPDWKSLISNDPGLLQVEQTLGAGSAADAASRDAQIQQAIETFGSAPDLASLAQQLGMSQADLQNVLTPDVQKLAQENTDAGLSTKARLDQANTNAIRQITQNLNKRGILNSGEAGYELDQQNLGYRQAQSDATQKLLGYLAQYQQGYLAAQNQRDSTLAGAVNDAANRQMQENQSSPGVQTTFAFNTDNGDPVYRGPDGTLYNADGTPYAYAAPNPAAPGYTGGTIAGGNVHSRLA